MGKRRHRKTHRPLVSPRITEGMEAQTASLPLHKSIAFRLPALQLDTGPLEKRQANECPREMRVSAASENAVFDRRMKQWLKKRTAFLKRSQRKVNCDADLQKINVSEFTQETLKDSKDAMGFLARELTEVKDALENNRSKIKRDKLQGLRKVVAGVLHTLRQDQLKTVLDSINTSSSLKYENITQAASLSPRVLNKAEKREPLTRDVHVCKGCKDGGLLPWMYLYPDHEVYRTGGGFDCVEFLLPAVHSEKPVTKPMDPFDKQRGKLVDTAMHRLPDRSPAQTTKPIPFKFKRERQTSDTPFRGPHADCDPSPIRKVEFEERRPRTVPKLEEKNVKGNKLERSGAIHSSLETILSSRDKESDLLNNTLSSSSSSNNTLILGWQTGRRSKFSTEADSGVVTTASSTSEVPGLEGVSLDEKEWRKALQFNELSTLQKRLTGLKRLGPVKVPREKLDNAALPKGPKKLVVRKSMAVAMPHTKGTKPAHNSGLLSKKDAAVTQTAFGVRTKRLKSVQNRKTATALDATTSHKDSTGTTVSDMSINFSASLSLEATSQRDTDEYSDFTLTGSQVTGTKRFLKERRQAQRHKDRKVSKTYKRLDDAKSGGKESSRNMNKKGRKESKVEAKKNEPTEVIVDIISSMISESASSATFHIESPSRRSSYIESRQSLHKGTSDISIGEDEARDQLSFNISDDVGGMNMDTDEEFCETDDEVDEEIDEEEKEEIDEVDDLPEVGGKADSGRSRRKMKKRKTLKFRSEPLSKFALKRRRQDEFHSIGGIENEDDLSMLDYAAKYCIISLQKLSKYEHVFTSYADCGGETAEHVGDSLSSDMAVESDEQRKLLDDYEKLIYGMDVCQQKISEEERKRVDLNGERDAVLSSINSLQINERKRKLLEKSIQAFSTKITSVDKKIKTFIDNMKKLIEKKRLLEDRLRQSASDSAKIDKFIKNSDFLSRKFTKLKCLKIKIEDLPDALRSFNSNFDDEDFRFVHHVLKLPQNDSLDFKAFAVVAALTERVKSLDKSIKALLKDVDLGTLERKLDKCKELYRLLSEENHLGDRIVPLENLLVELQAGGLDKDHQTSVVDKLNHHGNGFVDFLDFVLYVPLFLMIHDQIVQKPFQ